MENSIYIGLSRQMTLQHNMEIVANNVANMNTTGFRGQNLIFDEFISDPQGADDPLSFVLDKGQYQITDPGSVARTENVMDIALAGPGFIEVVGPNGQPAYTRAGNLQLGTDGTLLTSAGFPVSGSGGGNVTVPPGSREIKIDKTGNIATENGIVGKIGVVEFENIQSLKPLGNNLYTTDAASKPAQETKVLQGHLEGSNVKPVIEITRMIKTLRNFQSVQRLMDTENERLRTAIQRLTRQG